MGKPAFVLHLTRVFIGSPLENPGIPVSAGRVFAFLLTDAIRELLDAMPIRAKPLE